MLRYNPIERALIKYHKHTLGRLDRRSLNLGKRELERIRKFAALGFLGNRLRLNNNAHFRRQYKDTVGKRIVQRTRQKHLLAGGGFGWLAGQLGKHLGLSALASGFDRLVGDIPIIGDYVKPSDIVKAITINNPIYNPAGFATQMGTMAVKGAIKAARRPISRALDKRFKNPAEREMVRFGLGKASGYAAKKLASSNLVKNASRNLTERGLNHVLKTMGAQSINRLGMQALGGSLY